VLRKLHGITAFVTFFFLFENRKIRKSNYVFWRINWRILTTVARTDIFPELEIMITIGEIHLIWKKQKLGLEKYQEVEKMENLRRPGNVFLIGVKRPDVQNWAIV